MTPAVPPAPEPEPEPAPEKPRLHPAVRTVLCGTVGMCLCPEPGIGMVVGVVASVVKSVLDAWHAAGPSQRAKAAAAKQRYRTALRLLARSGLSGFELTAAQEAARQRYLRDLAEALK